MPKYDLHERAEMVRAMDLIARTINDEEIFEPWLINGVADGDIDGTETDEELDYYCEDDQFSDLMELFLRLMQRAKTNGLYCNGIVSGAHRYNKEVKGC